MTATLDAVCGDRLRVSVDGAVWEYDEPVARLGRLGFKRTAVGWALGDLGVAGGVFLDGCRVKQLPLFADKPLSVRIGAVDGPEVTIEVLPAGSSPAAPSHKLPPAVPVSEMAHEPSLFTWGQPEPAAEPEPEPVAEVEPVAEPPHLHVPVSLHLRPRDQGVAGSGPTPSTDPLVAQTMGSVGSVGPVLDGAVGRGLDEHPEPDVVLSPESPAVSVDEPALAAPSPAAPPTPAPAPLRIGRGKSSDLVLDDPDVSYAHAVLIAGDKPLLRDLNTPNGTWVNGHRIDARELKPGDRIRIGGRDLAWDGSTLRPAVGADDALVVDGISVTAPSGRRLLDGVTFAVPAASLTAVIGPSGSGKSTLLRAVTGQSPATTGRVLWEGRDLHVDYQSLRERIGLVPQEDILHPQLTVRQGLTYAARLRLPDDTSRQAIAARVDAVIDQLGLAQQAGQRIGTQLSGGQRKRVSIATELLTAPPLLFLDEPTSGLDPGLDRAVMHQLRELADDGRVVVVVTHSVLGLDLCDTVVVMARGGKVAYVGPPDGLLAHFGCEDYPQLFDLLEGSELWQRVPRPPTGGGARPRARTMPAVTTERDARRQLATLVRRNVAVMAADRLWMAMFLLLPVLLAALSRVVPGDAGLSLQATAGTGGVLTGDEAGKRLTILVVAAALMGAAMTVRELVKERAIFRREYAVGLSPGTYFLGKVIVLGTACALQGLALAWLALLGLPGPDADGVRGWGWLEVAVPLALLALTMGIVGLAVSALVRTAEHTMPALVGLVMVQLVLSSALVELAGRPVLDQLSWLAPSRWAYAAAAASVHLERAEAGLPDQVADPLFAHDAGQWTQDLLVLCVLALVAGWWGVRAVRRTATA